MTTKIVIFGITGDLSRRMLLPALRKIVDKKIIGKVRIIGVSRSDIDIKKIVGQELAAVASSCRVNLAEINDYKILKKQLALQADEQLVVYLAVPPLAATRITENIGAVGLNTKNVKILFEKPFGIDLQSAREMVADTGRFFAEEQIYRIDHYLAKEMAQNIVAFRSGNAILRNVWNRQSIESITILALENVGVEHRADFYEQAGALRDVVQGHLMQLLSLILMDTPSRLDWDQLPSLRHQAIARLLPADPARAYRAQYDGYQTEVDNPKSRIETFVAVELFSNSGHWEGVPLWLITGKALDKKSTEIKIKFRAANDEQSNCLRFQIQPDEGIAIDLYTKKPGYDREFETQQLAFRYPEDTILPKAYEQVIVDAVLSRKSLFTGSDEIIDSWRVLQPLLDAWYMDDRPLYQYKKGSEYSDVLGNQFLSR